MVGNGRPAVTRYQRGIINEVSWLSDEGTSDFKVHKFLRGTWAGRRFEKRVTFERTQALVKQKVEEICEQMKYDIIKGYFEKIRNSETEGSGRVKKIGQKRKREFPRPPGTMMNSKRGVSISRYILIDWKSFALSRLKILLSTTPDTHMILMKDGWIMHHGTSIDNNMFRVNLSFLFNLHSEMRKFHH
ncbi:uncharacterized protein Bfra_002519 [Botrytis fragariae]|uniref:Uncharacterized protein n=1 Tax=Botrytis fragariae TaxID=1964551 RepID=A0A8H6EL17_9HELO|nr:uncharacterized protein Bfra_002519 [Botrytis fragariae]KAF5876119.1 hypothetical protein Bfra_002519 [Botrytis fragariae]